VVVWTLTDCSIYDGVTLGSYGVGLVQGESVVLRGLMVCLGRYTNEIQYWDPSKSNSADPEDKSSKLTDLKPQEQNQTALRLRTTGAPIELCNQLAKEFVSFDKALSALLSLNDSDSWPDTMESSIDAPIVEVIICESPEDVEDGYTKVPVLKDGVDISDSFLLENHKILCYKQHLSATPPGNVIVGVSLGGPDESHKEDVDAGNYFKGSETACKVWVSKISRSKLGNRQPLTKIVIVTGDNEESIAIPTGFDIVCLNGKPVNVGNAGEFLFICTSKTSKLLGYPITPLVYSKVAVSEHGLIDMLDSSSSDMNNERLKKVDEEIQLYSQFSLIELHNHIKNLDKIGNNLAMKAFLLQIIQSHPSTLPYLLCKKSENFSIIYTLLKENLHVLESTIKKVINTSLGEEMCKILLHETIFQVILASSCAAPAGKLAELLIESAHPYENNMRHDQVITIPGAAGLRIEFDSQCLTESGCDILRFYKQPNHMGQISENSGRNFADFEVEGDSLHLYFYSDSSCVEWGYKFRVIPIESAPRSSIDPLLKRLSVDQAFWILEKVVLGYKELPFSLKRFTLKEVVNPLTIFLHTCKETFKQEKVLKINDLKRKKKKDLETDLKKDDKRFEDKKLQEKNQSELTSLYLTQANSSDLPASGAGKIICGKCGMAGHMKTNRKKCPMYAAESPENFRAEKEGMVKMEGSKIKLSIDKIQQAAEKKKEEHFYGDYSRPKTISARRRRQIEENPYEDIAFKLIRFDDTKLFINPVKKETYPDYYNYIQTPMDLTAINAKAKRGGYTSAQSFIEDLDLIVYNSTLYNGATHDVTHQSITIQQEGLRLLKEKELLIDLPQYSND